MPTHSAALRKAQLARNAQRLAFDYTVTAIAVFSTGVVLLLLLGIVGYMVWQGARALTPSFFTHAAAPVGEPGAGMAHAIVGSCVMLGVGSLLGMPLGVGAGVYLAEFGHRRLLNRALRFLADVLTGVPSIVIGVVVYAWIVARQGHFSALAGAIALALLMVPTVARTTEEMLLMVPQALREGAWGLGISRWRTIVSISLRAALPGIITGCMLAFARAAGETAPLLFTAFGNQFLSTDLRGPIAALPLQIFVYAMSPYDEWHRLAWAGALVLIALIAGALGLLRLVARAGFAEGGR